MIDALLLMLIAVVVAALLAAFLIPRYRREQRRRQEKAREEYGPEFERTARERGSERKAEQELRKRQERVESSTRPLPHESRRHYEEEWDRVEHTFVEDPVASLDAADRVVTDILAERNFPTDSRPEASKGVGVMHPEVVENFRQAQRIHAEATRPQGNPDPEEMRRAIQEYRSVYERLMGK